MRGRPHFWIYGGGAHLIRSPKISPPTASPLESRHSGRRAELRYETLSLSPAQAREFTELAAQGLEAVESFLGLDRRGHMIRFEICDGLPLAAAYGRTIRLPAHRVRSGTAPYLHEIVHALLPCRHAPPWFTEGLACYVECAVAKRGGGYDSHLFTANGNSGVDADAARWLDGARGRAVLRFVGARGLPPRIVQDRRGVAAPFYVLSQSLVKFLAERAGVPALVRMARARRFGASLQRETGRSVQDWREEWLERLRSTVPHG